MIRRKIIFTFFFAIVAYVVYGLFISQSDFRIIAPSLEVADPPGFYDYRGVINVHSDASTGTGSVDDIIKSAQEADLDFLFLTDFNAFERDTSAEGYHNKLFVFIDGEYSYLDSRLLNLNATTRDHLLGPGQSQALFADMLSQKSRSAQRGFFVLAHPTIDGFAWSGPYPPGLDGMEIVNLKSVWQDTWKHARGSLLWSLLIYPFHSDLAVARLFSRSGLNEIPIWDRLTKTRHMSGYLGSDAEQRIQSLGNDLKFPQYETIFRMAQNHILLKSELTGNAANDRAKIVQAIEKGQLYMSMDILANPKGFNAVIKAKNENVYPIGSIVNFQKTMALVVRLPDKPVVPFEIVLFRNGERIASSKNPTWEHALESPGTYRVEVRVRPLFPFPDNNLWVPWIFTNPFYVE
ncbi:MAG: hypothetical protein H6626_12255 [Pseudobdellovibrionaceae bacterium]|nr:hypothetical protein [Bdellovibrionales bacterium]USN46959.1 MAG: hypothetical protein H6626_12255 [Pseudobdellovibrionaceae bacterium]